MYLAVVVYVALTLVLFDVLAFVVCVVVTFVLFDVLALVVCVALGVVPFDVLGFIVCVACGLVLFDVRAFVVSCGEVRVLCLQQMAPTIQYYQLLTSKLIRKEAYSQDFD